MKRGIVRTIVVLILIFGAGAIGAVIYSRLGETSGPPGGNRGPQPAPVAVADIRTESIELRRTFSGSLEANARFEVAPKVSGRIEKLAVDIGDMVQRDQVVVKLDNGEYVQAVMQAEADLAGTKAGYAEARTALEIATRELARVQTLRKRGVASESDLDTAKVNQLREQGRIEVAKAHRDRAEASLKAAQIRLGYTEIRAEWTEEDAPRVVAERHVAEGDTVSANTPILSIIDLDPIVGVIFVTEKEYARLAPGQAVIMETDAYPGERFSGKIDRIAPVFRQDTRQARVELTAENPRHRLKPGMFIRATVVLDRVAQATVVPEEALTMRNDQPGLFVVSPDRERVHWQTVTVGVREGDRVQVTGQGLEGRVVVLGQQLLDDGSPITIPADPAQRETPAPEKPVS